MPTQPLTVYWKQQLVGIIPDPKIDNFDVYGHWQPVRGDCYEQFSAECASDAEPWVVIGQGDHVLNATVQALTATDMEIKIRLIGGA